METDTYFVDTEGCIYQTKIDLFKKSDQLVEFKIICYQRVVEYRLNEEKSTKVAKT